MIIHLATDHAGFAHKEAVAAWLRDEGYEVADHGATILDPLDDFPDFIVKAARAVSAGGRETRAIIFGGSGQGEAMLANRFPKVRAAVYYGGQAGVPALSRQHNDANILSIGARFVQLDEVKQAIREWLNTELLPEEKYQRRNRKIETITKEIHL